MNRDDPLTPEEQALARMLGRGREQAPSAAVDAAILAAARAALHDAPAAVTPVASRPRRIARWPAALGVAASVVVAVGLAWQLRPQLERPPSTDEAAAAAVVERAADADAPLSAPMDVPPPPPAPEPAPAPEALPRAATPPQQPVPPAAAPGHTPARRAVPASPPARVPDAQVVAPPSPPAPPAPLPPAALPAPAAPASVAEERAAVGALQRSGVPARASAKQLNERTDTVEAAAAAGSTSSTAMDAQLKADERLSRRRWLAQIRGYRDAGDTDLARASLERYLQHYPHTPLPPDLRQLLEQ